MQSLSLWHFASFLPGLLLDLAGIALFLLKFERAPIVRLFGVLGFGLRLALGLGYLFLPIAVAGEVSSWHFSLLNVLGWASTAAILAAIALIPLHAAHKASERD